MQSLRSARFLARLVLAWFVLAMGMAIASPMAQPGALDLVCAGGGLKLVQQGDDGQAPLSMGLDCPLCGQTSAPPPAAPALAVLPVRHADAATPTFRAPLPPVLRLPPARGPPAPAFT
ncbi:MAG: hypothetical protein JWP65_3801 [Ramlibacter sp.]|uniref:DUF2946 family protein n=1 Tax=Ramlibacter sp. TaxID=1917967 RepID=UPI002629DE4E|nr:DUF2946 family protein [Ramlibacter sp.]MDB5753380.1 hypothetical protein [Ramlibacter sp.]